MSNVVFTPYRVCPLGAHVDHQHGYVTGFAIDKGVKLRIMMELHSLIFMMSWKER